MFSPTHVAYTGEQVEVICESTWLIPGKGPNGPAVTLRTETGSYWTVSKEYFDAEIDPMDWRDGPVRRYAPIVGE
jgi:hypothetical protein